MADLFDELSDAAQNLAKVCKEAFHEPKAAKSCSHAVWYVLLKMKYKEVGNKNKDWAFREANDLINFLSGQTSGWAPVKVEKAFELANKGIVVIGGLKNEGTEIINGKETKKHGHVIVVHPGTKIHSGGGLYPRALSRSSIKWPGATSCGDKTVRDPWKAAEFKSVRFWAPLFMTPFLK